MEVKSLLRLSAIEVLEVHCLLPKLIEMFGILGVLRFSRDLIVRHSLAALVLWFRVVANACHFRCLDCRVCLLISMLRSMILGSMGFTERSWSRSFIKVSVLWDKAGVNCLQRPAGTLCLTAVSRVSQKNFSRVGMEEVGKGQEGLSEEGFCFASKVSPVCFCDVVKDFVAVKVGGGKRRE